MPTYDYLCKNCNDQFEQLEKIENRDDPCTLPCHKCSEYGIVRVTGSVAIVSEVQTKDKRPSWFRDRLDNIKKVAGRTHEMNRIK